MSRWRVAALLFLSCTCVALRALPEITSVLPLALRQGGETQVTFSGTSLGDATNLWTSFVATHARSDVTADTKFSLQVSNDVGVGIYGLRLFGDAGPSNLRLIMVDDLATVAEHSTNKARAAGQPLAWPIAVDAICNELSSDWFTIHVAKGQRVAIEVVSARLGYRLDSVVRVLDSAGREMAYCDDGFGMRADSRCAFVANADDDYAIEVRDVNYGGGTEFRYRLRIGDFPLVATVWPPVIKAGERRSVALLTEEGDSHGVMAAPREQDNSLPVAVTTRRGFGSAFTRVLVTSNIVVANESATVASPVELPAWFVTRGQQRNQWNRFRFTLPNKGPFSFRARTRSMGSPCDVVLRIEDDQGNRLAESNPALGGEDSVTHTFAAGGTYQLEVRETVDATGPALLCAVEAAAAPGFTLTVDNDRAVAGDDGGFELKVGCTRSGYKGPIALSVAGLLDVTVTNNIIAEGKTNTTLRAQAIGLNRRSQLLRFRISGHAGHTRVPAFATTAPALRKQFSQMLFPPAEFDGEIVAVCRSPRPHSSR